MSTGWLSADLGRIRQELVELAAGLPASSLDARTAHLVIGFTAPPVGDARRAPFAAVVEEAVTLGAKPVTRPDGRLTLRFGRELLIDIFDGAELLSYRDRL